MNTLYFGDNLEILRKYIPDESVDLVYLDPPFKSNATYNVLFREMNGTSSPAQIKAFDDTWHWDEQAARTYFELIGSSHTPPSVVELLSGFERFLGHNDMFSYLVMMAPRLWELRRALKQTGSLYLHCDPTASHYLKILLDSIFGAQNFRNEIVWKRTSAHSDPGRYGANIDILLFATKSNKWTWNQLYRSHDPEYIARFRIKEPDGRRWADDNLTAKGLSGGGYEYEYKGVRSLWRCPLETMERLDREGRLHFTKRGGIRLKRYLDDTPGVALQSLWDDIPPINSQAHERLGYPTQKPEALLERIIQVSSNKGESVLDPFCGCGTTIAAAQKLKRKWIGIDITYLAINLIKSRLKDTFGSVEFEVHGEPKDAGSAKALAEIDRFAFQLWALSLIGARPLRQPDLKGPDRGIDGVIFFIDESTKAPKKVIAQVKSGKVSSRDIRDLHGTMKREKAVIGAFITLEKPTREMTKEAASAGFYESEGWGKKYPTIQILSIRGLLNGSERLKMPPINITLKKAEKQEDFDPGQPGLGKVLE
jgi:site-specific DNA-methyltransferase (adenine-specific)